MNSYHQCPKQFKLSYIDALPRVDNAFSDWGLLVHYLLEQYFSGKMEFFELSQEYDNLYKEYVTHTFPPNRWVNLNESYYNQGKEYLDNFDGDFEGYEVLEIEKKFELNIKNRAFVGIIDLVLRSPDKTIVCCDHKSKKSFASKKEEGEYLRQLYLYSLWIKEEYGEYPSQLIFNLVRGGKKVIHTFKEEELEQAKKWFLTTIDSIYKDVEFKASPDVFFCDNLCGVRHHCPYSNDYDSEE